MTNNAIVPHYDVHARGYLERAKKQLSTNTIDGLLYATLELRMGIERRQIQYAKPWDQISEKAKKAWRATDIGKALEKTFKVTDQIVHVTYMTGKNKGQQKAFIPVSDRLLVIGEKVGGFLHAKEWSKASTNDDVAAQGVLLRSLHELVVEGLSHLHVALMGTMLGPPLEEVDSTTGVPCIKLVTDELGGPRQQPTGVNSTHEQTVLFMQNVPLAAAITIHHQDFIAKFPCPDYD